VGAETCGSGGLAAICTLQCDHRGTDRGEAAAPTGGSHENQREAPPWRHGFGSDTSLKRRCDGRQHCSQMTSCDEATFFIKNCPDTKTDGDRDGVPCQEQWCSF